MLGREFEALSCHLRSPRPRGRSPTQVGTDPQTSWGARTGHDPLAAFGSVVQTHGQPHLAVPTARELFPAPLSEGTWGEQCPPRGTKPGRTMGAGRRAAQRPGCGTPGSPDPEEILLFFTCELKQTQAPVYFLVDCILEDGGGFPTPGSFNSSRTGLARPSPCSQRCLSARQDPAHPRPPIIYV